MTDGRHLEPQWSRLKTSDSPADREKEGLRLSMQGGDKNKKQKAVVEFLCPPKQEDRRRLRRGKGGHTATGEEVDDDHDGRLKYISYAQVEDTMVLSLEWTTKYACENANDEVKTSSGHWGFFTWLIIM